MSESAEGACSGAGAPVLVLPDIETERVYLGGDDAGSWFSEEPIEALRGSEG